MNTTRRTFLAGAALSTLPVAAVASLPAQTPEQRIEAAIAEIEAAFAEMYPGWRVQKVNKTIKPRLFRPSGEWEDLPVNQHAVCLYVSEEKYGPENFFWSKHCA